MINQVDTQEIYRRFSAVPLRLKASKTTDVIVHEGDTKETKILETEPNNQDDVIDNNEEEEMKALETQIDLNCRLDEQVSVSKGQRRSARLQKSSIISNPSEQSELGQGKKQKRTTRAVSLRNVNTGGLCIDTPTKALQPPKRSRKVKKSATADDNQQTHDDIQPMHTVSINMESAFEEIVGEVGEYASSPEENGYEPLVKQDATVTSLNSFVQDQWMRLTATKTTIGTLFALWLKALASGLQSDNLSSHTSLMEHLAIIGNELCTCERLVQSQDVKDDKIEETRSEPLGKQKKSVRFRQYDLSSINLHYLENDKSAHIVEQLLNHYAVVKEAIDGLRSLTLIVNAIALLAKHELFTTDSSDISTNELHSCQLYFYHEFTNVFVHTTKHGFMEERFSFLISSLARYRLRLLFVPFDPTSLEMDKEDVGNVELEDVYQDFGAGIHCALRTIHMFEPLISSLLAMLDNNESSKEELQNVLNQMDPSDLLNVDHYIRSCRYLRLSMTQCILPESITDASTGLIRKQLEELCCCAQRLGFQDEEYLYPLMSIETFVTSLVAKKSSLRMLECLLPIHLSHDSTLCVECNQLVTSESIKCIHCHGTFHLSCLHLPSDFTQLADQYTCPFCFVNGSI